MSNFRSRLKPWGSGFAVLLEPVRLLEAPVFRFDALALLLVAAVLELLDLVVDFLDVEDFLGADLDLELVFLDFDFELLVAIF